MIKKLSMIAPVFSLLCSSSLAFASPYSSGSDVHFIGKIVEPSCFVSTNNNEVRLSCGRSQEVNTYVLTSRKASGNLNDRFYFSSSLKKINDKTKLITLRVLYK